MLNLSTMQHSTRQRNTTQQRNNGSQHNATQHNKTDTTQRVATQRNATQHNGLQHNAMQQNRHNRTHLNTTKQEIKTAKYAKQTSRGNVELDQKLHRKKRSKNAAGIVIYLNYILFSCSHFVQICPIYLIFSYLFLLVVSVGEWRF